ncbi:MAG: hypothetical protein KKB31_02930 [Nanoarchaeota archaeon]|nr:hypothetical protein [Nanoarchaeota archaeon]
MIKRYSGPKSTPLTEEEIKGKYKEIQEELQIVLEWKKEEEEKIKDPKASPQKKSATKRALKKVARRIDTVKGQIIYWKLRVQGQSHFRAGIEMNEYWESCNNKKNSEHKDI